MFIDFKSGPLITKRIETSLRFHTLAPMLREREPILKIHDQINASLALQFASCRWMPEMPGRGKHLLEFVTFVTPQYIQTPEWKRTILAGHKHIPRTMITNKPLDKAMASFSKSNFVPFRKLYVLLYQHMYKAPTEIQLVTM